MTTIKLIAVPYWLGKKEDYSGCVEVLKDTGIAADIGAEWVNITPQFSDDEEAVVSVNKALANTIRALPDDSLPFIMAADCTSCWGAMAGLQAQAPDILWLDAHGDFNTPETSPSGFLGGMPLAAMVGKGNQELVNAIGVDYVAERRITVSDVRDLDPEEAEMLENSEIAVVKKWHVLKHLMWNNPLYIHFDADVLHLYDYPAVSYPAADGVRLDDANAVLTHVMETSNVVGMLFSLWNESLDGAAQSRDAIVETLRIMAKAVH